VKLVPVTLVLVVMFCCVTDALERGFAAVARIRGDRWVLMALPAVRCTPPS
jgi:hypothetical protein